MLAVVAEQLSQTGFQPQTERVIVIPDVPVWLLVVLVIVAVCVGIVLLVMVVRQLKARQRLPKSLNMVSLLVTLPRALKDVVEKEKTEGEDKDELISIAETMYTNLSAIDSFTPRWRRTLFGRDALALELVLADGEIRFYIACSRRLKTFVERQVQSQYPKSQIEEAGEYTIFGPGQAVRGSTLRLMKKPELPVKTYRELESDPLNALTNALAKLPDGSGAAIQLLIRPASAKQAKKGRQAALKMQQGRGYGEGGDKLSKGLESLKTAAKPVKQGQSSAADPNQQNDTRRLTPLEEETVRALEEKTNKVQFETNVRVLVSAPTEQMAQLELNGILSSFTQYNAPRLNGFKQGKERQRALVTNFIFRYFNKRETMVLNTAELASIFHFPTRFTETPKILWLGSKKAQPPLGLPSEGISLGTNTYRGVSQEIRIANEDRMRHLYLIGRTGTGKSTLLENMIVQDIRNGEGLCVIDPHGDLVENVLLQIPKERAEDVVLFSPSDTDRPVGLNMLEFYNEESKDFVVQEMIGIFYKLFPPETIGPLFEHNMRNVMLTLMADPNDMGTVAEIPRMFTDDNFQKSRVAKVKDPVVRAFWEQEMAQTDNFHKSEMLGYLVSKVGRFVENEMMRNIIGQARSGFNVQEIMDQGKILLVNLSKGTVGEVNSDLLGLIIVSKLQMAAFSRAARPESQRRDFFLYIDEFQNYTTDSISTILSEARKYRLGLTVAHQFLGQLVGDNNDTSIRDAIFGNVGTMVAYRIGVDDAETFAKEFEPVFDENDVINIEKFNAYVKLMVGGTTSQPFNMSVPAPERLETGGNPRLAEAIRQLSRAKHGRNKAEVEAEIARRAQFGRAPDRGPALDPSSMGPSF
ncbi:MAG: type IV secretion system DNA-binding domain-containing protein [Candidatus Andersenbacteria bacterium]|nr:type IV secretion system DNA-binding domain-containing protein [Candidatus Andersenbacteria bacterium]